MTEQEFLSLENHDRIKYIGTTREIDSYSQCSGEKITLTNNKKYVVHYVEKTYEDRLELCLYAFGWMTSPNLNISEWELVERRHAKVIASIRNKNGISQSKYTLRKCRMEIEEVIESCRERLDAYLEDVQLADKLKLLSTLPPDEKRLADLLFEVESLDDLLEVWEKGKKDAEK